MELIQSIAQDTCRSAPFPVKRMTVRWSAHCAPMAQVAALSVLLSDLLPQTRLADIAPDVYELPSADKGGSQEVLAPALPQTDRAGMDRGLLATPDAVPGLARLHHDASAACPLHPIAAPPGRVLSLRFPRCQQASRCHWPT